MEFVATAPGRAGIIGNPSDIYGGVVLSCSVEPRNQARLIVGRGTLPSDYSPPEDPRLWNAVLARFPLDEPAGIEWTSAVPRSSGLSGSTAALAATLLCVLAARGDAPDLTKPAQARHFAELVRDIERNEAGIVCGYQDAYMIVHGGCQRMDFAGKHPTEGGPEAALSALAGPLPFVLVTTGVERLSGSVHGPLAQRWLSGEKLVVEAMARIAELGRAGSEAYQKENWTMLAELMQENQRLTASVGGSGEAIDALIEAALDCGARAAKLAGAGMGGTIIALVEDLDEFRKRLSERGYERFTRVVRESGAKLGVY